MKSADDILLKLFPIVEREEDDGRGTEDDDDEGQDKA